VLYCSYLLQDVTADEFHNLMELLGWTALGHTVSGQQELVDIVADQAEINQNFDPKDPENDNVDRLIQCVKHALPYFSVIVYEFDIQRTVYRDILIIKANEMHCFSNLFDKVLYMFGTGPLSIIWSISTLHSQQ